MNKNNEFTKIGSLKLIDNDSSETLTIYKGIRDKQIEHLIHHSNTDSEVICQTSDPKRFKNKETYSEWRKKGRTIYILTDDKDNLLGVIWLGEEKLPEEFEFHSPANSNNYGITFTIRLYQRARGKHLSRPLTKLVLDHYKNTEEYNIIPNKGIWLETSANNIPAVTSYTKFGFKQFTKPHGERKRIIMVL